MVSFCISTWKHTCAYGFLIILTLPLLYFDWHRFRQQNAKEYVTIILYTITLRNASLHNFYRINRYNRYLSLTNTRVIDWLGIMFADRTIIKIVTWFEIVVLPLLSSSLLRLNSSDPIWSHLHHSPMVETPSTLSFPRISKFRLTWIISFDGFRRAFGLILYLFWTWSVMEIHTIFSNLGIQAKLYIAAFITPKTRYWETI